MSSTAHATTAPAPGTHPWRAWPVGERTLTGLLDHVAATRTHDEVFATPHEALTALELRDRARGAAGQLAALGVTAGDRVAIFASNRIETVEALFACSWLGAVFAAINPELRGSTLLHQLKLAEPTVIVADAHTREALVAALASGEVPGDPRLVFAGGPGLNDEAGTAVDCPTGWTPWAPDRDAAPEPVAAKPGDLLAILYTSGTTGPAKGVMLPQSQLFHWGIIGVETLELVPGDVLYTCLPLFHTNALTTLLQALAAGGRAVVGPHFSVSRHWQRLSEAGATVTFLLGAMTAMLWNRRPAKEDLPPLHIRTILGPGTDPAIRTDFEEYFGLKMVEGFGMTELGVPMYTAHSGPGTGTLGVVHPDYEVRIVDDNDEDVPDGTAGELVVRNRVPFGISLGYFHNDAATVEAWRNLWFHTGDLVAREADGTYRYLDRIKDSIRRRGENISSYEVESAFLVVDGVDQAAAIAVPSPLGEDEVMVCLIPAPGVTLDPATLLDAVRTDLPKFAVPRYVRVMDAFPLTHNGKVSKKLMRDEGVTADTWDAEGAAR